MSKEAVGQNGAVLGSADYWDHLNRSTYIGTAMQRTSETEYFEAVKLAWFVGGDPAKIRKLQSKLNEMHIGEHLTEDGVYGKKTEQVVEGFFDELFRGSFHTLTWVNPLQILPQESLLNLL